MPTVTLDRFGRVVIPKSLRQRHGWRAGTTLTIHDGPDGLSLQSADAQAAAPPGWVWQDGLLVSTATPTADISDLTAIRDALDAERDRELGGM